MRGSSAFSLLPDRFAVSVTPTLTPILHAVCDIFVSLQGEGTWTGRPTAFVRFWGCPLHCPWCDEPRHRDPGSRRLLTTGAIIAALRAFGEGSARVLLTGGEPLAREGLGSLVSELNCAGFDVAMETSGVGGAVPPGVAWVTLSPKWPPPPEAVHRRADEIKFVVPADPSEAVLGEIARWSREHPNVWVQPQARGDEPDPASTRRAVALVMESRGRLRLSLQTHKWIGLP
ncbi:MAG: 7-carboxy-7-deazaguanine synthase QueE [Magnetococcales bacterium]|nr:7-carboxy-7-deazaguanine synthase QueE [Magnetococcales bacterium]